LELISKCRTHAPVADSKLEPAATEVRENLREIIAKRNVITANEIPELIIIQMNDGKGPP